VLKGEKMALFVVYDRNFRNNTERELEWKVGDNLPDIAPHRIIEITADGEEKTHIETIMGMETNRDSICFYGDVARTVWVNL